MDVPTTKSALIQEMEGGRREWDSLLSQIDHQAMEEPGVEGIWSVKQIVAHIAGYEEFTSALLADRLNPELGAQRKVNSFYQTQVDVYRREHPDFPPNLDSADDDQTNELVVSLFDRLPVQEVLARERAEYQKLLWAVRGMSEAQLAESWRPGGRTFLALVPNQCYAHYQMHMPAIRDWVERRKA